MKITGRYVRAVKSACNLFNSSLVRSYMCVLHGKDVFVGCSTLLRKVTLSCLPRKTLVQGMYMLARWPVGLLICILPVLSDWDGS